MTLGKLRQQIVIAVWMVGCCVDDFKYFLIKLSIEHPSILYGHLDNNSSVIDSIYCSNSIQWSPRMNISIWVFYILYSVLCSICIYHNATSLKCPINFSYIYLVKNKFDRIVVSNEFEKFYSVCSMVQSTLSLTHLNLVQRMNFLKWKTFSSLRCLHGTVNGYV